ncbi:MAG: DMT family transporter [Chloroflexota bacterium]|nr:DMT family transporter [Chloroflexota bacterium]MDE3101391.1 DMT family transporter [Chloroflexota bacterium]
MPVVLAYLAIALSWGGTWPVGKVAVGEVPPLELSAIRFALVGLVLLAVCLVLRIPLGRKDLGAVVLAAALGIFLYNALVFVALTMAPASDGALIVPTSIPVLTAVAALTIGERMTGTKAAGFAVATIGGALVIVGAQTAGGAFSVQRLLADLMALGGAACWAAYGVAGHVAMRDRSPIALVALTSIIGAAMLFPLGLSEHAYRDVPAWPLSAWALLAYLVVFATIVGFVLFQWSVRRFGAGVASMVSYLVPVAALAIAAVWLAERPAPLQLLGGAVILAGVRVATLRRPATMEVGEAA